MPATLKIKVTKEILEASKMCGIGLKGDDWAEATNSNCAVALAVRDIFPQATIFQTLMVVLGKSIRFPFYVTQYIKAFDNCAVPEERLKLPEFEFEVSIPDEVIDQINIDEIRPLLVNHPTLELIN